MSVKKIIGIFILLNVSLLAYSQRGWEVGGGAGISHYFGDLNSSFNLSSPHLSAGIFARRNFNNRLCTKLALGYGRISGNDALSNNIYEQTRNLSFRSDIFDASLQFEFNFLPYTHGSRDEFFTPYLLGGLSMFKYNPKALYEGNWIELRPLGTEGQFKGEEYYSTSPAFVYGGGIKFDITEEWSINVELSMRNAFTDYVDDVHGTYPNKRDLLKLRGPMAVALSDRSLPDAEGRLLGETGKQRGNPKDKDKFAFLHVSLVYYFGDLKCPSILNR